MNFRDLKIGRYAFTLLPLVATLSCALSRPAHQSYSDMKITGGTEARAEDDVSLSTVAVVYNRAWYEASNKTCTGTLIGKRVVITAAHCFSYGKDCEVIFGLKVKDPAIKLIKGRCAAHERYQTDGIDIAMIYLDEDAPQGYRPVPYLKEKDSLSVGQDIIFAGYGRTDGRSLIDDRGTLRHTKQKIFRIDDVSATFEYRNGESSLPGGQCSGDSGGPTYIRDASGQLVLAGVVIGGDLYCRERGRQTDIRKYTEWIVTTEASLAGPSEKN
jgi:secreted trypsin-like serine protease